MFLRGTVPTDAARRHATVLTSDSVGATAVINELTVPSKAIGVVSRPLKPISRRWLVPVIESIAGGNTARAAIACDRHR